MRGKLFFLSFFVLSAAYGQTVAHYQPPAYLLVTTYSKTAADVFSTSANPAATTSIKKFSAGIYSERRFLLSDLSFYTLAATLPTSSGTFSMLASYSGGPALNRSGAALGYARNLSDRIGVGARFHYYALSVNGYGSASTITFDVGLQVQVAENVRAGLHVFNPVKQSFGKTGTESLPAVYNIGLGYDVSPQVHVSAVVQKVEDQPVNVVAGLHYQLAEKLLVRGGVSTATSSYFFGAGFRLKGLQVHTSASFHPYLGTSPALLFLYQGQQ